MSKGTTKTNAGDLLELPALSLPGAFLDTVDFIEGVSLALIASVGEVEETGQRVLVPFVSVRVSASKQDQPQSAPLFSTQLTLEDSVYLLSDLGTELLAVVNDLVVLSAGGVKLERKRIDLVKTFVGDAAKAIEACRAALDKLETN